MQLLTLFFGDLFQYQKIHDVAVRPNRSAHLHLSLIGVTVQRLAEAFESNKMGRGKT